MNGMNLECIEKLLIYTNNVQMMYWKCTDRCDKSKSAERIDGIKYNVNWVSEWLKKFALLLILNASLIFTDKIMAESLRFQEWIYVQFLLITFWQPTSKTFPT